MKRRKRGARWWVATATIAAGCATAGWPNTSRLPVTQLDHALLQERAARLADGGAAGYTFYAFGDQRALADGEWQRLMSHIVRLAGADERALFMIDTGDIVDGGHHADQFRRLAEILSPASDLPYLVGVGNHEKNDNKRVEALRNTAEFLGYLDSGLTAERMYYGKTVGPVRFLFLDTSDFVYGNHVQRKKAMI